MPVKRNHAAISEVPLENLIFLTYIFSYNFKDINEFSTIATIKA